MHSLLGRVVLHDVTPQPLGNCLVLAKLTGENLSYREWMNTLVPFPPF
jgi:hypothetical protein